MALTILVIVFLLAAYYPLRYGFERPWKSSSVGAAAFTFSAIVAVVLGLRVLREVGLVHISQTAGLIVYAIIAAGLLYQDVVLTRALRRRHSRDSVSDESREVH